MGWFVNLKKQIRKVANKALKHLKDKQLTAKWMFTENPVFGGLTPAQMVQRGRKGKVIKAIEDFEKNAWFDHAVEGSDLYWT